MQQLTVKEREKLAELQRQQVPPMPALLTDDRKGSKGNPDSRKGSKQSCAGAEAYRQAQTIDPGVQVKRLPAGTKCRYYSTSQSGWIPAVVGGFNDSDGTYNVDVRPHAKSENICPAPDVPAAEAWPPGTSVLYESSSMGSWLPAVVFSFNEGSGEREGTYNLDIRECASVDRMRL